MLQQDPAAPSPTTAQSALAHWAPDRSTPLLDGSVGDALRRAAAGFPDRRALVWPIDDRLEEMTYRQLLAEAEQTAFWLLERAAPGDRIAIWSRNCIEWIVLEYGCTLAGMVVTAWNTGWSDYECEHARDLTEPALLIAGRDTRGVSVMERAGRLCAPGTVFPIEGLRERVAGAAPRPLPEVKGSDLFLIQFTSGTTGRAKGAALSHRASLNAAWLRAVALCTDEDDVYVNPSPMNHMGGAISMVLGALVTAGCLVVLNRFDAGEYLRLMRVAGATRIGGVPVMMYQVLDHPDWKPGEFKLRSLGSGGAQVPKPLVERMTREFNAPVSVAYAQSESPAISNSLLTDDAQTVSETVGLPSPHVEVKVIDTQTGATLRRGEAGEICVRGPLIMDGYYRMPDATTATIDGEGFLHTGDVGSMDDRGYLRISGRVRDVIIRGGENIYPAEVEDVLLAHPDVANLAVVGVDDERWGQQVGAAVLLREGASPEPADLEAFAATRLAHFKVPRRWLFVDSLPLTASGKVRKVEVEGLFRTGG